MTTYTSITLFSLAMIVLLIIIVLAVGIRYLVKKRVARATAKAMEVNKIMLHAIGHSEHLIVALALKENIFHNVHDKRLPADGLPLKKAREMVHPDDREAYDNFVEALRYGEKQEDTLEYRFNTNYKGGEPVWHLVKNHAVVEYDKDGNPIIIFFTMTDETDEEHIRLGNDYMTDKYQQLFEDSIVGLSFYNAEGRLIECNKMMREICNFEEHYDRLFYDSPIYDLAHFNVSSEHPEELWFCSHLELPKRDINKFVEIRVHPMFDSKGKLKYIALAVRDVTEERNLYLQSRENGKKIRKANQDIKQYEEQLHYLLENSKMHVWRTTFKEGSIEFMSDLHNTVAKMTIEEFANTLQTDEKDIAIMRLTQPMDEKEESIVISRPFKNMLEKDDKVHWYNLMKIPEYDENKVQTGYFGLIRDVTLLMEEQEMLRRETERANDSDRMKSVFLANMTHEIRTPLNAIVGFSDLLQAIDSPDEKLEMMRIIRNNCDMLLRLINDFLAISTIESNGLSMNIKEIDFAKEFNDFYTGLTQRVGETSVEFICDNPYASLITKLDIERIGQVITNFVTNAVKYTQQGHIKIGYKAEPDGLYIYCEDTGTGIAKEDCERIFERFVKLNDYIQGTGLGLSICKAIVERCNGTIGVESELGKGSTFWFRIPCEILGKVKK